MKAERTETALVSVLPVIDSVPFPLPRCPAYEGSLATCITSVPGAISGDTTLNRIPVAV